MIFRGRGEKCGVMSSDVSWYYQCCTVGRDISVGIATRYGVDGPKIESRWGRNFPHPTRPALGLTEPPKMGTGSFPGGKVAGAWR